MVKFSVDNNVHRQTDNFTNEKYVTNDSKNSINLIS